MADDHPIPKPRGRPPSVAIKEAAASLTTWIKVSEYDKLAKLAHERHTTVSALARSLIVLKLR